MFAFDVEAQAAKGAHIDVRDPDNREAREYVSPPVIEQKFVSSKPEDRDRDVVAETVLTRKQVEELSLE